MRIGFDARMIDHPGIGRYITNLLNAMLDIARDCEFILYGDPPKLVNFKNCNIVEHTAPIYDFNQFFHSPFEKDELDIVHIPHFNVPFQKKTKKLIITMHDLIYLKDPRSHSYFIPGIAVKIVIENAISKADKIIAVSENTKKDILQFFKRAKSENIKVIYEAADPCFKKITDRTKLTVVKEKHNLPNKFILFVGSLKYHKNLKGAVEVFSSLKEKIPDCNLVVLGRPSERETHIEKLVKSPGVLYCGEVSSDDLVAIYNLSFALLHLSLYEGFGLTIVEAMACGVPVVCSKTASLPEIAGDAALLVDPYNTAEACDGIYNILTNESLRNNLVSKGLERVKRFSWQKAAEETLSVYKEVLN